MSLGGTSIESTVVSPCFHTRTNLSSERISTWSCFSGSIFSCSTSGRGGPGTWASALIRAMWVHTAVIRRNEMVTISKSIIGIMLISESSDLRFPPPPPPTSTPPIRSSTSFERQSRESRSRRGSATKVRSLCSREPPSAGQSRHADFLPVRDDQVQHLHARLVDVVLERLGLAVEHRESDETDDRDD